MRSIIFLPAFVLFLCLGSTSCEDGTQPLGLGGQSDAAGQMADGGDRDAGATDSGFALSGQRLRAVYAEAESGARSFLHYYDRDLDVNCRPFRMSQSFDLPIESVCAPLVRGTYFPPGFCGPRATAVLVPRLSRGDLVMVVDPSGEVFPVRVGDRSFWPEQPPECDLGPAYSVEREDRSILARGVVRPGSSRANGRLRARFWEGEDGSRGVVEFEDLDLNMPCRPGLLDGVVRCLPVTPTYTRVFTMQYRDLASCTQRGGRAPDVDPWVRTYSTPLAGLTLAWKPLNAGIEWFMGEPAQPSTMVSWTERRGCGSEPAPEGVFAYTPWSPALAAEVSVRPEGELRSLDLVEDRQPPLDSLQPTGFLDTERNQNCTPFEVGDRVVCATPGLYPVGFSDPACTEPLSPIPPSPTALYGFLRLDRSATSSPRPLLVGETGLPVVILARASGADRPTRRGFSEQGDRCVPVTFAFDLYRYVSAQVSDAPPLRIVEE